MQPSQSVKGKMRGHPELWVLKEIRLTQIPMVKISMRVDHFSVSCF